jgi:hypothetical protein
MRVVEQLLVLIMMEVIIEGFTIVGSVTNMVVRCILEQEVKEQNMRLIKEVFTLN